MKKLAGSIILILTAGSLWAGATFSRITTWSNLQVLTAAALNAEFDNILNNLKPSGVDDYSATTTEMRALTDPYPGSTESLATSLQGELERIRYQILELKKSMQTSNVTYWYQDLPTAGVFTISGSSVGINDTTPSFSMDITGTLNVTSTTTLAGVSVATMTVSSLTATNFNVTTFTSTNLTATTATLTNIVNPGVQAVYAYKRPTLTFVGITSVDIENNTGTANQTTVMFPDGNIRSVTEDTATTNKYRRFLITVAAEFTSGTEDSGLRSGLSEATNTWYAIYAVKSTIDATKFVMAGDTTLPTQANFATLNSRYGTSGWVYIGMIRNGDADSSTGDILNFTQTGNYTAFKNTTAKSFTGIEFAGSTSTGGLNYTLSRGTGTTDIPNNIKMGIFFGKVGAGATVLAQFRDVSGAINYCQVPTNSQITSQRVLMSVEDGFRVENTAAANVDERIYFVGFYDSVLGLGSNSQL